MIECRTDSLAQLDTRQALIRAGIEMLSERGFVATGIERILKACEVPKGSFYHYFASKNAFGLEVLVEYDALWQRKLARLLRDSNTTPLQRIDNYILEAAEGLKKFDYKRGCLVGNMAQELAGLDDAFRVKISAILTAWGGIVAECLREAVDCSEVRRDLDVEKTAEFFWTAWEGAILRAKLDRSVDQLQKFRDVFFGLIGARV
jgi:TetR/AcrR family transcriptional regulator, transcriptional repressor for nem operon